MDHKVLYLKKYMFRFYRLVLVSTSINELLLIFSKMLITNPFLSASVVKYYHTIVHLVKYMHMILYQFQLKLLTNRKKKKQVIPSILKNI